MPYKGEKDAARPPGGSLIQPRCLIKGPKSAIVLFQGHVPDRSPEQAPGPRKKLKDECVPILFAASHQTRLDKRSKTRRPIKVGIKGRGGRERIETRTLLVCAAHRLTYCNVSLMSQVVSRTQMWVRARMPVRGLN